MIDKDLTPDFLEEILSGIDKERNAASALDKLERKGGPAGIVEVPSPLALVSVLALEGSTLVEEGVVCVCVCVCVCVFVCVCSHACKRKSL